VLGLRDEYSGCVLAGGPPGYLSPEPLRSLGGLAVRAAVERAEAAEQDGRRPDPVSRALRRLVSLTTPRAIEPRMWGRARRRQNT
jgi:hypothetical protein